MEAIEAILEEISRALMVELYHLAIVMTLTLPDICSGLESPNGTTTSQQYKQWCEEWLAERYPELTGLDMYSLRCGVIHQGRFGHDKMQYGRVIFTFSEGSVVHQNIMGDALNLDVKVFCNDVMDAVAKWGADKKDDRVVQRNLPRLVRRHPNGLSPYLVGLPVIS